MLKSLTVNIKGFTILVFLFLLAFAFETFFSSSTSWLYDKPVSVYDSSIFQIIGKYWAAGVALPYKDLWDSKGPMIFALNALGYLMTGTKAGVFVIQVLFLTLSLLLGFRFFRCSYSKKVSLLLVLLLLMSLSVMVYEGNVISEYALPLLLLSYLLIYHWLCCPKGTTHPWSYALVYGLTFGWCFMSRLTDFVGLGGAILAIFILLIFRKQWSDIVKGMLSFVIGALLIVLPFQIYFSAHNLSYEFWYGTLLYNFGYAGNSQTRFNSVAALIIFLKNYMPLVFMFVLAIILIAKTKTRLHGFVWLFSTALSLLWFLRSRMSDVYAPVTLPYICIFFIELHNLQFKLYARRIVVSVVTLFYILGFANAFYRHVYVRLKEPNIVWKEEQRLMDKIPIADRNKFCAFGWMSPQLYLYADICPCYPYFTLQEHECEMNEELSRRIVASFSSLKAKWILVRGDKPFLISPILKQYYQPIAKSKTIDETLYMRSK